MKFDSERFKAAIQASPLTVQEIADKAGTARSVVYRYMGGEQVPGGEHLASLARVLGVPMESFFCPDRPIFGTGGPDGDAA